MLWKIVFVAALIGTIVIAANPRPGSSAPERVDR